MFSLAIKTENSNQYYTVSFHGTKKYMQELLAQAIKLPGTTAARIKRDRDGAIVESWERNGAAV